MTRTLRAAAATGIVGMVLGAGFGIAAAGDERASTTPHAVASMDAMHAEMRDGMPEGVAARCDEMHASMPEDMASMDGGGMRSMVDMPASGPNDEHGGHHR